MPNPLQRWKDDWNQKHGQERFLRVRWLLNPNETPLENVELVEHRGVVTEIRPLAASGAHALPAILIPTLVNAHTHLEFSMLTESIRPALPFQDWITALIRWRRGTDPEDEICIRKGLAESCRCGVTSLGEITTTHAVLPGDVPAGSTVISFREILGLQQEQISKLMQTASDHLNHTIPTAPTSSVQSGLSPHAPYSVHPKLYEALIELAVSRKAPVAMHLAETTDEIELLQDGKGAFVEFLQRLGLWNADVFPGGRTIRDFLEQLARIPRALAIHGNYFSSSDIQFLARHTNIATVYCPRTHAFFRHTPHPLPQLLEVGASVVLGTDSRASNPDLSVWKELQCVAAQFPHIPIPQLLALATTNAADALGLPVERHRIRTEQPFHGVILNADPEARDLRSLVRHSSTQPVITIMGDDAE